MIHPWALAYGRAREQGESNEPTHRLKLGHDDLPRETALSEAAGEGQTSLRLMGTETGGDWIHAFMAAPQLQGIVPATPRAGATFPKSTSGHPRRAGEACFLVLTS